MKSWKGIKYSRYNKGNDPMTLVKIPNISKYKLTLKQ